MIFMISRISCIPALVPKNAFGNSAPFRDDKDDVTVPPPVKKQKVTACAFEEEVPYEDVEFITVPCRDLQFEGTPYELPELVPCI